MIPRGRESQRYSTWHLLVLLLVKDTPTYKIPSDSTWSLPRGIQISSSIVCTNVHKTHLLRQYQYPLLPALLHPLLDTLPFTPPS